MTDRTTPPPTFDLWICHTEHRVWVGGDYNGHWTGKYVGEKSLFAPSQEPDKWTRHTYVLSVDYAAPGTTDQSAGPDFGDGCDHEGFPGGCERFGHSPATCPTKPTPP